MGHSSPLLPLFSQKQIASEERTVGGDPDSPSMETPRRPGSGNAVVENRGNGDHGNTHEDEFGSFIIETSRSVYPVPSSVLICI